VLLLIEAGEPDGVTILLRLENTLIGAVIAAIAYLVLPAWKSDNLTELVRQVVSAHRRWTAAVLSAAARGASPALSVRPEAQDARDAMLAARPSAEAALIEPHHPNCDPVAAMATLDACHRVAMATTSLEVLLRNHTDTDAMQHVLTSPAGTHRAANIDRYLAESVSWLVADQTTGIPESRRLAQRSEKQLKDQECRTSSPTESDAPIETADLKASADPTSISEIAALQDAGPDGILDELECAAEATAQAAAILRAI
jgi:hypothetical protein